MAKVIGDIAGVPNLNADDKFCTKQAHQMLEHRVESLIEDSDLEIGELGAKIGLLESKVYTKDQITNLLSNKANKGTVYTKDEVDEKNAVQNEVIKNYVDERCNDIIKTITQELEITTSGRDGIPHTELVRIADAKSDALRDVTVTVDTDYVADANICYLEVYSGGTTMVEQLYRTIYNPFQGQKTAIFTFSYSGEFSVRARWENEPINAACTIRITYVRDLPEVIGNIETALDAIIEIQNSLIGGDGE